MTYSYLNIRFNSTYSKIIQTEKIIPFVNSLIELKQTDKVQFKNTEPYPWGVVSLVKCSDRGNYSLDTGEYFEFVNLIELLFLDKEDSRDHYIKLGAKIARKLQWEMIDDDTDEIIVKSK